MRIRKIAAAGLIGALALNGFDTGHHRDLTWSALRAEGFTVGSVNVTVMANWLPDFYQGIPSCSKTICEASRQLHFDNLDNVSQVQHYWRQLAINTKKTVQQYARGNDAYNALAVLVTLGASLHAVQDFYSHSNWNELHPKRGADYSGVTWWNAVSQGQNLSKLRLYTGDYPKDEPIHGNKGPRTHDELNKDHYGREKWDEAYIFAYAASRQWVRTVGQWVKEVNPDLWDKCVRAIVIEGTAEKAMDRDLAASYGLSAWIFNPEVGRLGSVSKAVQDVLNGGHWKGPGSTMAIKSVSSSAGFLWDTLGDTDSFTASSYGVLSISSYLSEKVYEFPKDPETAVPPGMALQPIQFDERALFLRSVTARPIEANLDFDGVFGLIRVTSSDPALEIEIKEAPWRGLNQPNQLKWQAVAFLQSTQPVTLNYNLWAERSDPPQTLYQFDLNPDTTKRDFQFSFSPATGACTGAITTCSEQTPGTVSFEATVGLFLRSARIVFQ